MHVQPLCRQEVPERLTYFEVYVGNVDFPTITSIGNPVCGIYEAPTKSVFTFDCSPQPMAGQYVTVHLRAQAQLPPGTSPVRDGYLTVCEIQVFGYQAAYPPSPPPPPPIPSLLSQGKPVIQSSTYLDPSKFIYDASLAVDGKTDPVRPKVSAAACSDAHARVGDRRRGPSPWSPPPPMHCPACRYLQTGIARVRWPRISTPAIGCECGQGRQLSMAAARSQEGSALAFQASAHTTQHALPPSPPLPLAAGKWTCRAPTSSPKSCS